MARAVTIAVLIMIVFLSGSAGLLLLAHSEPFTDALDSDLAKVRAEIKEADGENSQYAGGAIKALILVRRQILRTSEAMLDEKRASLIRRIDLHYIVNSREAAQVGQERLTEMTNDIDKANAALSK